ncbi:MAG: hypothetical protein NXI26_27635 [bacterium]|nr:hypothetical protein [bacterium]
MKKHIIFILSAPYSGSTLLSHLLGATNRSISIGEAARFRHFAQYQNDDYHYLDECSLCSTNSDVVDCPIWNNEVALDVENLGVAEAYWRLIDRCEADIIIDNSKNADWMNFLCSSNSEQGSRFNISAVLLVRHPVSFVQSNIKRIPEHPASWHINGWVNMYTYMLHWLAKMNVQSIVIRYEELIHNSDFLINRIIKPINSKALVDVSNLHCRSHHPLGGNILEIARNANFSAEGFDKDGAVASEYGSNRVKDLIASGGLKREQQRGIIKEKPTFHDEYVELFMEAGVMTLCRIFGYSSKELYLKFDSR